MAEPEVSSPTTPNISFRELDDEFMQKQAKVWLEAVLDERYGEGQSLSELLADGDILFRVSKLIKELIRHSSGGDAAFPRLPFSQVAHDGKGGRYLPYSNVDAFLKMCKRVGLPDVDLFSPPDVVEKKDIRRVCFCIRALSKKARQQKLQVPDFDRVAHVMPMLSTDKVGGIREHLKQAAVASQSPTSEYKSSKPGKVLSSPNLQGSTFLDTPVSVKEGESGRSSPVSSKFEEEESASYEEEKPSASEIDEDEVVELEEEDGEEEQDLTYELDHDQPAELLQNGEDEEDGKDRAGGEGKKRTLVVSLVALVASVLAVMVLRPRRRQEKRGYYVVKEGDTLAKISRTCGKGTAGWKELVNINPRLASNPDLIYPTDTLKLSPDS